MQSNHCTSCRSFPRLCSTLLALVPLATSAPAQDIRAFAESMFLPSGPSGPATAVMLTNTAPLLGSTVESVVMAPGRTLGVVIVAAGATAGTWVSTPCGYNLLIHVDLGAQLGSIPMLLSGTGRGTAWLSIPYDPGLVGLDLAWQAAAWSGTGCDFAASNLVTGNVGSAANQGSAEIAFTFGPVSLLPASTWSVGGAPVPVVTNSTSGNTQPYRIVGTKTAGVGPLQLVDQFGTVVASAASGETTFTFAVGVAPNRRLFLRNGGATALGVSWRTSLVVF